MSTYAPLSLTTGDIGAWRRAAFALTIAFAVFLIAFFETASAIVSIWWRSGTFTHGFLVPPIVAWLIWRRRRSLAALIPHPAPKALAGLAVVATVWWVARQLGVAALEHFAFVTMIPGLVWLLLGTAVVRSLAFPFAYLLFAVPFGEFLVPPLQDLTAAFTVQALNLTGIPVLWEGRYFHIASGSFEVAEACSGVRYLIASVALGTLYAYLTYTSYARRALFIALSAVVPIIANGVRAYGIVMIAHLSDYRWAVGVDHFLYGWVFFGVVMFALFWVGHYFRETSTDAPSPVHPSNESFRSTPRWPLWTVVGIAVIISAPIMNIVGQHSPSVLTSDVQLPSGRDGWSGPHASADGWMPSFPGTAAQRRGEYRNARRTVHVYLARAASSSPDVGLLGAQSAVYDPARERRLAEEDRSDDIPGRGTLAVHETRIQAPSDTRVIWSWYRIDGRETANRTVATLLQARARFKSPPGIAAVVVVATDYAMEPEHARAALREFLSAMLPTLRGAVDVSS